MALRLFLLTLLFAITIQSAELPFHMHKGALDFGIGVSGASTGQPFSSGGVRRDTLLFEIGAVVLYDYGIRGESQLIVGTGGVYYKRGRQCFSVGYSQLEAFNLYTESYPSISYSYQIGQRWALGGVLKPSFQSVINTNLRDRALGIQMGMALYVGAVTFHGMYDLFIDDPDVIRQRCIVRSIVENNRLGSQGVELNIEMKSQKISLTLAEVYPLHNKVDLTLAVKSKPLFINLGFVIHVGSVDAGALFSRHSDLGWARGAFLQYGVSTAAPHE